jgi:hypothetical protein
VWANINSSGLGLVTYSDEKRNEFSDLLRGDINRICKQVLLHEVSYRLSVVSLQTLQTVHVFFYVPPRIRLKFSFLLASQSF